MLEYRLIPCLLFQNGGLVKTKKFKNGKYIGDPINAIRIFNEKEVDELLFINIEAAKKRQKPDTEYLKKLATECFMPFSYGGGIQTIKDIENILSVGVEKVVINTAAVINPSLVNEAAMKFGSSTIVVSVDYKKNWMGKNRVSSNSGTKSSKFSPLQFSKLMEEMGAGELIIQNIDREGSMKGLDITIITEIASNISIPIIASGGVGRIEDFRILKQAEIQAVAVGSFFVFKGSRDSILINYPSKVVIEKIIQ